MQSNDIHIVGGPSIDWLLQSLKTQEALTELRLKIKSDLRVKIEEITISIIVTGVRAVNFEESEWGINFKIKKITSKKPSKYSKSLFPLKKELATSYSTKTKQGYFSM